MSFEGIEKYIERLGITDLYEIDYEHQGSVCIFACAFYKNKVTFSSYYCYHGDNTEDMKLNAVEQLSQVKDGIFRYLGNDELVLNYFESKAKEIAKRNFNKPSD